VAGFHAGLPGLDAGFVGVDVFFVISGFLITGILVREVEAHGSVRLGAFWARRARRLVPAVTVVIVTTLAATILIRTPLSWRTAVVEALAATTYWSNHLFADRSTDYFGAAVESSPLLHTWTLAVEEQFYVFWPIALALALRFLRRPTRRSLAMVVFVICVASLWLCIVVTDRNETLAFFASATRAWEFGAGALLAIGVPALQGRSPGIVRTAVGTLGIVFGAAALTAIDGTTAYPGWAATLPVAATSCLVYAGLANGWPGGRILGWAPLRALGRLSYSWYLWHWPVLILGVEQLGTNSIAAKTGLVTASLLPAYVTYRLVESPIRFHPSLQRSVPKSTLVVSGFAGLALVASALMWVRTDALLSDPLLGDLAAARADLPPLDGRCASSELADLLQHCVSGAAGGASTILVVGDSHAAHWLPAIAKVARQRDIRVIASLQGSCVALGPSYVDQYEHCVTRIRDLPRLVDALNPDAIVLAHSVAYVYGLIGSDGEIMKLSSALATWRQRHYNFALRSQAAEIGLGVILDNPRFPDDPIECVARHRDARPCRLDRATVDAQLRAVHTAESDALLDAGYGVTFDPVPLLCTDSTCPVTIDGEVAYQDQSHLTAAFARHLAPALNAFIEATLAGQRVAFAP